MEVPGADIEVPGRSGSPTPVITPVREDGGAGPGVCSLCLSGPGKYTCPRCNAPYCSLACYRGPRHTACSELFYRESVLQALREEEAGPRGRRQIQEMLLRMREEAAGGTALNAGGDPAGEEADGGGDPAGEEADYPAGEEADGGGDPAGVMTGEEAELWNSLTAQEKEQFTRLVRSGDIGALVPQWKPWWHPREIRSEKILELSEGADGCDRSKRQMAEMEDPSSNTSWVPDGLKGEASLGDQSPVPPLLSSIPPLCSLSRNPSPLVKYTVVNVLYGYAFSLLRHNGDVSDPDILLHFTGTLLSISAALSTNAVYNSTAHALKGAVRAASDPQLEGDRNLACTAMEATSQILHGDQSKTYSLAALSHLCHLLGKVRKHITGDHNVRKRAFSAKKKCLFLAAWVKENEDCLAVLSGETMAEYRQYMNELSGVAEISRGLQKAWGGKRPQERKKLIQEVPTNEV